MQDPSVQTNKQTDRQRDIVLLCIIDKQKPTTILLVQEALIIHDGLNYEELNLQGYTVFCLGLSTAFLPKCTLHMAVSGSCFTLKLLKFPINN